MLIIYFTLILICMARIFVREFYYMSWYQALGNFNHNVFCVNLLLRNIYAGWRWSHMTEALCSKNTFTVHKVQRTVVGDRTSALYTPAHIAQKSGIFKDYCQRAFQKK